jgi:hypothetical protein
MLTQNVNVMMWPSGLHIFTPEIHLTFMRGSKKDTLLSDNGKNSKKSMAMVFTAVRREIEN